MGKIGVTLNEEKTCLRNARRESFNFLGYTFGPMISPKTGRPYLGAAPSRKAIQGLREQVRGILHRSNTAPREEVVKQLNQTLKGWQNYFDYGSLSRAYEAVNWSVLEHMRFFLRRRHKVQTRTMWRRFPAKWIYAELGVFKLRRRNTGDNAGCGGVNPVGELDAGKLHVQFDERGSETGSWIGLRHRYRRKSPATATPRSYSHRADPRLYCATCATCATMPSFTRKLFCHSVACRHRWASETAPCARYVPTVTVQIDSVAAGVSKSSLSLFPPHTDGRLNVAGQARWAGNSGGVDRWRLSHGLGAP